MLSVGSTVSCKLYPLVMTNSSPWKPWPIEIDGLPWFTELKNGAGFQGYVTNNQMLIDVESDHSGQWDRWSLQGPSLSAESEEKRGDSFACTCVFNHYINYIFEVCDTVVDLQNAILLIYSKGVQCIADRSYAGVWLNIVCPITSDCSSWLSGSDHSVGFSRRSPIPLLGATIHPMKVRKSIPIGRIIYPCGWLYPSIPHCMPISRLVL